METKFLFPMIKRILTNTSSTVPHPVGQKSQLINPEQQDCWSGAQRWLWIQDFSPRIFTAPLHSLLLVIF